MKVVKKNGEQVDFDFDKIKVAVTKSAERVMYVMLERDWKLLEQEVKHLLTLGEFNDMISVSKLHLVVETALDAVVPDVAKSYKDYRNYKQEFTAILDSVFQKSRSLQYIGDYDNANTDSSLVATKRSLVYNHLNKEFYKKFFLTADELEACEDGYIYVHDMSARLDTVNCCLFDLGAVMDGGFEMGNIQYNEPNSLDTAFDVMGDIILSSASQQYGK